MIIFSSWRKGMDLRKEFEEHVQRSNEQIAALERTIVLLEKALKDTREYCDRELAEIRENTPKRSSHRPFQFMRRMAEEGAKRNG